MRVIFLSFELAYAMLNLWAAWWMLTLLQGGKGDWGTAVGMGLFLFMGLITSVVLGREVSKILLKKV